jgi:hypothetical protein
MLTPGRCTTVMVPEKLLVDLDSGTVMVGDKVENLARA